MKHVGIPVALTLLMAGCGGGADPGTSSMPTSASTTAPTTASTISIAAAEYLENFEFVWTTINEGFYDPDFGGVDWDAVHDRYVPDVAAVGSDRAFLELMNEMLFELDTSHLFIVPPDAAFIDPMLATEGELGIHVRLLDQEWVITAVEPASPAADAGLRPGYLLDSIAGREVTDIASSGLALPPSNERGIRSSLILSVEEALYGEPGDATTIGYRDATDRLQQVTLTFRHRGSSAELLPGLPPVFTTLEADRLEGGIGYIAFDPFAPGLEPPITDAIDAMRDAPGLIIDVRGNHGGNSDVAKQIIDKLVVDPVLIWTWQARHTASTTFAAPSTAPYDGPVVVLVDIMSGSAAEAFSGGIQAIGRAHIVGERTVGRLLGGELAELPMGALMIYPITAPVIADGSMVEGRGVIPDIPVAVDRSDLLAGIDPALRAAIDHLQSTG